jgi:hypothetical protein
VWLKRKIAPPDSWRGPAPVYVSLRAARDGQLTASMLNTEVSARSTRDTGLVQQHAGRKLAAVFGIAAAAILVALGLALLNKPAAQPPPLIGGVEARDSATAPLVHILTAAHHALAECTGTLVAARLVLTAGHCVQERGTDGARPASGFRVNLGERHGVRRVSLVVTYPGFRDSADEGLTEPEHPDAGLLVLSTPVGGPKQRLSGSGESIREIGPALIAGWSHHLLEARRPARAIAHTTVQDPLACEHETASEPRYLLCALDTPSFTAGVCAGDSGGPLLVSSPRGPVEVGIARTAFYGCSTHHADVFTRVSAIRPWINGWIKKVEP